MKVIICPGVHETQLTDRFVSSWQQKSEVAIDFAIFPTQEYPAYSPFHLYSWLHRWELEKNNELFFVCFSAGVVAGIGAILALQLKKIKIRGMVAIDGWGVPLWVDFPLYRFSHDYFTHWSSALLGRGKEGFYCDPPVEHLTFWEQFVTCQGWIVKQGQNNPLPCSAMDYFNQLIAKN